MLFARIPQNEPFDAELASVGNGTGEIGSDVVHRSQGMKKVLIGGGCMVVGMALIVCTLTNSKEQQATSARTNGMLDSIELTVLDKASTSRGELYEKEYTGKSHHYQDNPHHKGICGFAGSHGPKGVRTAAIYSIELVHCGMCINVTGKADDSGINPGGETFFVHTECSHCGHGDVAFHGDDSVKWNADISWKAVPCPTRSDGLEYLLEGSNKYFIQVRPLNAKFPVEKMEAKINGVWVPAKLPGHVYHFQWTEGGPFEFPLKVRLTSSTGEVVEDSILEISDEVQIGGGKKQFEGWTTTTTTATTTVTTNATTTVTTTTATTGNHTDNSTGNRTEMLTE